MTDIIERAEACAQHPYVPNHVAACICELVAELKTARAQRTKELTEAWQAGYREAQRR
jgi:hypothetical protein